MAAPCSGLNSVDGSDAPRREISPDGGGALSSKQEKISPSIGMITEIEEVGGVQKYIYIKLGKKNRRLKKGLLGYIYNDLAMKEKIGKFELIQVFRNFSKGKIIELNYKIDTKAIVAIEVDPRYLIK
ncbi:MAG: hypothetical protein SVR08_11310 [Spirochaetota bacterium]|nr:hypothetical protein [Spirochaetota bacterium]